jgi:hypothetical protein
VGEDIPDGDEQFTGNRDNCLIAGKDFDCWDIKASAVSTENMKQENLLIFSKF